MPRPSRDLGPQDTLSAASSELVEKIAAWVILISKSKDTEVRRLAIDQLVEFLSRTAKLPSIAQGVVAHARRLAKADSAVHDVFEEVAIRAARIGVVGV